MIWDCGGPKSPPAAANWEVIYAFVAFSSFVSAMTNATNELRAFKSLGNDLQYIRFRREIHDFYGYKKCSELRTSPKVVWRNKLQNLCQVLWQRWVPNFHLKWSLYSSGYAYSLPPRSGSKKNHAGCHFKVEECTGRSADSKVSGWQDSCQHTIQHQDFASRVHGIW